MVDRICEARKKLVAYMETVMDTRGVDRVNGEMVDMVKDLAEAEKDCWKARYYRSVVEAMERGKAGHEDSVEAVRNIVEMANPDEKERMKAELRHMLDM